MTEKKKWIKTAIENSTKGKLRTYLVKKGLLKHHDDKIPKNILKQIKNDKDVPLYYRRNANMVLNLMNLKKKKD